MLSIMTTVIIVDGELHTRQAWLSVCYRPKSEYNTIWLGMHYHPAVIAALLLLLSCCLITRRRRRFSQTVNPNVKPPLFGSAPPGYSLPFWNNDRFNQSTPAQNNTNDYTGGNGGPSTAGGYQYPPRTASNPPPPPYGTDTKGPYSPVSSTYSSYLRLTNVIPACRSTTSGAYHCKSDCLQIVCVSLTFPQGEDNRFVGGFRQ